MLSSWLIMAGLACFLGPTLSMVKLELKYGPIKFTE
jgi:hypothetical protein